jgi:hypothetical protein
MQGSLLGQGEWRKVCASIALSKGAVARPGPASRRIHPAAFFVSRETPEFRDLRSVPGKAEAWRGTMSDPRGRARIVVHDRGASPLALYDVSRGGSVPPPMAGIVGNGRSRAPARDVGVVLGRLAPVEHAVVPHDTDAAEPRAIRQLC